MRKLLKELDSADGWVLAQSCTISTAVAVFSASIVSLVSNLYILDRLSKELDPLAHPSCVFSDPLHQIIKGATLYSVFCEDRQLACKIVDERYAPMAEGDISAIIELCVIFIGVIWGVISGLKQVTKNRENLTRFEQAQSEVDQADNFEEIKAKSAEYESKYSDKYKKLDDIPLRNLTNIIYQGLCDPETKTVMHYPVLMSDGVVRDFKTAEKLLQSDAKGSNLNKFLIVDAHALSEILELASSGKIPTSDITLYKSNSTAISFWNSLVRIIKDFISWGRHEITLGLPEMLCLAVAMAFLIFAFSTYHSVSVSQEIFNQIILEQANNFLCVVKTFHNCVGQERTELDCDKAMQEKLRIFAGQQRDKQLIPSMMPLETFLSRVLPIFTIVVFLVATKPFANAPKIIDYFSMREGLARRGDNLEDIRDAEAQDVPQVPSRFIDGITYDPISEPVTCSSGGYTYSRKSIKNLFLANKTIPETNQPFSKLTRFRLNLTRQQEIDKFAKMHNIALS